MRNWRPISLLNVDYKIATRAICGRLLTVLSTIIGPDQTCGVGGRTISKNLFLIRDLLDHVERENLPLALLSLDQEKAFDRVDWGFLCRILHKFNFGPDFLRWVQLFYTNIESAVVINGWTSSFFWPSRGACQGCPLSPLLYVISIEVLAVSIRTSPRFPGMTLPHSMQMIPRLPPVAMRPLRRRSQFTCSTSAHLGPVSIGASRKACGLAAPGRLAPIPLMGCNGLKICRFSVRPSTLVITASQRGIQLFPSWNVTSQPGLGEGCPFRARQPLLPPWPSPRSGISVTFFPSLRGRRNALTLLYGTSFGRASET